MNNGKIVFIDKPAGWTSFDVVAKIRSFYQKQEGKRIKVGHAGTLDPFATGLLIVLVGAETKNQEKYMKQKKEYTATLCLGATSSTGDPEGSIERQNDAKEPSEQEAQQALLSFLGEIEQTPPAHSAIKIDGQRAYKLARRGEAVVIPSRKVTIYKLDLISYEFPLVKIRVECSSGTYIRSLAVDIGKKLGTGAYLTELRRTKIGNANVRDAVLPDSFLAN